MSFHNGSGPSSSTHHTHWVPLPPPHIKIIALDIPSVNSWGAGDGRGVTTRLRGIEKSGNSDFVNKRTIWSTFRRHERRVRASVICLINCEYINPEGPNVFLYQERTMSFHSMSVPCLSITGAAHPLPHTTHTHTGFLSLPPRIKIIALDVPSVNSWGAGDGRGATTRLRGIRKTWKL